MVDDLDPAAVERAARAAYEEAYDEPERHLHPWETPWVKQTWLDIARAALAAARAGEVEHRLVVDDPGMVALCSCGTGGQVDALDQVPAWFERHLAAQRGGEADVWTCGHCGRASGAHSEGGPAVNCLYEPVLKHAQRGGEAEHRHAFPSDPDDPQTCIRCGAQRGGEAVDREAEGAISDDELARPLVQAMLAARGDAPVRTVSAAQVRSLRERLSDPAWRRESLPARVEGVLHALDLRVTP